jgi:hypothetical protein
MQLLKEHAYCVKDKWSMQANHRVQGDTHGPDGRIPTWSKRLANGLFDTGNVVVNLSVPAVDDLISMICVRAKEGPHDPVDDIVPLEGVHWGMVKPAGDDRSITDKFKTAGEEGLAIGLACEGRVCRCLDQRKGSDQLALTTWQMRKTYLLKTTVAR